MSIETQATPASILTPADTLENGFTVVNVELMERITDPVTGDVRSEFYYVLASGSPDAMHPYATWAMDKNGGTFWGHYHATMSGALSDFVERTTRFNQ